MIRSHTGIVFDKNNRIFQQLTRPDFSPKEERYKLTHILNSKMHLNCSKHIRYGNYASAIFVTSRQRCEISWSAVTLTSACTDPNTDLSCRAKRDGQLTIIIVVLQCRRAAKCLLIYVPTFR